MDREHLCEGEGAALEGTALVNLAGQGAALKGTALVDLGEDESDVGELHCVGWWVVKSVT